MGSSLALLTQNAVLRQRRKSQLEIQMEDRADEANRVMRQKKEEEDRYDAKHDASPRDTERAWLGLHEVTSSLLEGREKSQTVRHEPSSLARCARTARGAVAP